MSDDWRPGDLALCVDVSGRGVASPAYGRLRRGALYTVLSVTDDGRPWLAGYVGVGLIIDGPRNSPNLDWAADRFRKIKPLTDTEREEAMRDLKLPARENV